MSNDMKMKNKSFTDAIEEKIKGKKTHANKKYPECEDKRKKQGT